MASRAWKNVERDFEKKFATVVVDDENLKDFPKFMRDILEEKIGLEEGFFKVRNQFCPSDNDSEFWG